MIVESKRLKVLFRKAAQVEAEIRAYVIAGDKIPVSVEDIQSTVGMMYTLTIEKHIVPVNTTYLQSMMLRYANGRIRILVKAALPHDEKRFAVCKEISHVIMDEQEDWSLEVLNTITNLIEVSRLDIQTEGKSTAPNGAIITEKLAAYLAIELLYPHDLREADFVALEKGETSFAKLALRYEIPLKEIETAHAESLSVILCAGHNQRQGGVLCRAKSRSWSAT